MKKHEIILSLIAEAKIELEVNKNMVIEFNLAEGFGVPQFDSYMKQKIARLEARIGAFEEVLGILESAEEPENESRKFNVSVNTDEDEIFELLIKSMEDVLPMENRMYVGDRIEVIVKYRPEDK